LIKATEVMNSVLSRTGDDLPPVLKNRDVAKAFYGVVSEVFEGLEMKEKAVPYGTANLPLTAFHKKATAWDSLPLAILGIISSVFRTGHSPYTR
jgi:hypothetical protein